MTRSPDREDRVLTRCVTHGEGRVVASINGTDHATQQIDDRRLISGSDIPPVDIGTGDIEVVRDRQVASRDREHAVAAVSRSHPELREDIRSSGDTEVAVAPDTLADHKVVGGDGTRQIDGSGSLVERADTPVVSEDHAYGIRYLHRITGPDLHHATRPTDITDIERVCLKRSSATEIYQSVVHREVAAHRVGAGEGLCTETDLGHRADRVGRVAQIIKGIAGEDSARIAVADRHHRRESTVTKVERSRSSEGPDRHVPLGLSEDRVGGHVEGGLVTIPVCLNGVVGLDFATHEVDPGARIHRDIHLTRSSEDQHPRPCLHQASRTRDRRSLLLDPVGIAGGVGQVVLENGIVTDHKLTGRTGAPERGIKNDQATVRDRGPAGVAGDIVAVDRQGRITLLHQGERSGTAPQILVTDVAIIGRIGCLVDREGGAAVVSHLDPGSPLVVFDRRPSRIGSGEGQVADRQIVTEQGDIGVGVGGIEKEVHVGTELVGSTHLQHAEDSANRTGAVVPHDNGSTPSVEECGSVGVG